MKINLPNLDSRRKRTFIAILSISFVVAFVLFFFFYRGNANDSNTSTYHISRDDFQEDLNQRLNFFRSNNQDTDKETVEQDTRTRLLNEAIVRSYAQENNIRISDEQLESYYKSRVDQFKSEQGLLNEIDRLYGMDKQDYKDSLRYDLLRESVQSSLNVPLAEWLSEKRATSQLIISE